MFIVNSYFIAVMLCVVTMICWGSWGNTQKLAGKTWRFELFYWDYAIGMLLFSILMAFTLGSNGESGRSFIDDLGQAETAMLISAFAGGVIFNASNILLSASISIAGLAVAFPLGVGLALVLGVFVNYFSAPKGDPVTLFIGVFLIVIAIIVNGIAASKNPQASKNKDAKKRNYISCRSWSINGFLLSICSSSYGFGQFRIANSGYDYTIHRIFHILGGSVLK